mgnify:CR=1 FL=1
MSKRSKYSTEEKYQIISEVIEKQCSMNCMAKKYALSVQTISRWIHRYQSYGLEGLKEARKWKRYDHSLKKEAVLAVIQGEMSLSQATRVFHISSDSVLSKWISSYTNGEPLKSISRGRESKKMNKGRKTTYQERIEIVQYTIANDFNYAQAIEKYHISYQQVYSWVKKYQQQGEEALKDQRGRKKGTESLTEEERLKLRIKELEERNKYLEMENDFAKKLREIQRQSPHSHL